MTQISLSKYGYVCYGPDGRHYWSEQAEWPEGGDEPIPATVFEKFFFNAFGSPEDLVQDMERHG